MIKKGYEFKWIRYQGTTWHLIFVIKSVDEMLQSPNSGNFECVMWMTDSGPRYFKNINIQPLDQYEKYSPKEEEMRDVVRLYFEGNK